MGGPPQGVDYAFHPHPDAAGLAAAGIVFACRYSGPGAPLGDGNTKWLTLSEAHELNHNGISIVTNAEGGADGLLGGWDVGYTWAITADRAAQQCGMPADRPIYLSVDFDVTRSQWPQVRNALAGAAAALGSTRRVGIYGGRLAIELARQDHVAEWFWQTYAWSGGHWVAGNHIEQYQNGVQLAGAQVGLNRALQTDIGQWNTHGQPTRNEEAMSRIVVQPDRNHGWWLTDGLGNNRPIANEPEINDLVKAFGPVVEVESLAHFGIHPDAPTPPSSSVTLAQVQAAFIAGANSLAV